MTKNEDMINNLRMIRMLLRTSEKDVSFILRNQEDTTSKLRVQDTLNMIIEASEIALKVEKKLEK